MYSWYFGERYMFSDARLLRRTSSPCFFFCHNFFKFFKLTINSQYNTYCLKDWYHEKRQTYSKSNSIFRKNIGVFWCFSGNSVIRRTCIVDIFYCSIACNTIARQSLDFLAEKGSIMKMFLFTH